MSKIYEPSLLDRLIDDSSDQYVPPTSFELNIEANDYTWEPKSDTSNNLDIPMLPFQIAAMNDTTSKILGIVAGYG